MPDKKVISHSGRGANKTTQYVLAYFHGRCIVCPASATVVHEIEPRARGETSMRFENRVALCAEHHEWAHNVGANASGPTLVRLRKLAVARFYG